MPNLKIIENTLFEISAVAVLEKYIEVMFKKSFEDGF
jgi:hypothetical protein